MKRTVFLVCLLATGGCAVNAERQLASTYEEARLEARRDDLIQARTVADRGVALAPPDSEWAWTFRLLRGEILLQQRQPADALSLVAASLPQARTFDRLRARQKYLQALVQRSQNRFADALATLEAARQVTPDAGDVQFDINWLDGQLRMRLGQWADAETRLNAVISAAAVAGDRFQQARALNGLGTGSGGRGRWDEALPRFQRVLSFEDLKPLSIYAAALLNAGICYSRLGEFEPALRMQRASVQLQTEAGRRTYLPYALGELGSTLQQQGEPQQALPYLRQALAVSNESKLQAEAALWAGNLAAANVDLGEWNEAERFNEEAKRLKAATHIGNVIHNTLNAAHIAQGRSRLDEAERLFEEALAGAAAEPSVRWSAHAGLAAIAVSRSQPAEAARHFEAALDTIEKTRSELLKTEYKLSFLTRLI